MKNLVIYYSRKGQNYVSGSIIDLKKGNSEIVAEYIQSLLNADLFEIETVNQYPLDYRKTTEVAMDEYKSNARPKLVKYLDSTSEYDNIIVVGPCWWADFPMPIYSLLDNLDLDGQNLIPIMTHEGSGLGKCESTLKRLYPQANVLSGLAIHGTNAKNSQSKINNFINNLLDTTNN